MSKSIKPRKYRKLKKEKQLIEAKKVMGRNSNKGPNCLTLVIKIMASLTTVALLRI